MWLEVGSSNSDLCVVAQFYVDCVRQIVGTPKIIRADCRTKNIHVATLKRLFLEEEEKFIWKISF